MPRIERQTELSTSKERKQLSAKQVGGLLMASVGLISTLGTGCSAKPAETPKQPTEITQETEQKVELSASEQSYAEYLKTLSPEQVELRESLNPDALAEMNDDELAEAFTIKADEVMIDGKLDPELYAEAFTARIQAMDNSGISENEYSKWGGLDNFNLDTIREVAKYYSEIQTMALFGYVGNNESTEIALTRGSSVDSILKGNVPPKPKERFHYRIMVIPDSTNVVENSNGTYDVRFSVRMSDNWEQDVMYQQAGVNIEPSDGSSTWNLKGLRILENGSVMPSKVELGSN